MTAAKGLKAAVFYINNNKRSHIGIGFLLYNYMVNQRAKFSKTALG